MKILQVIHDFLPRHQAGSELYCYHISKELQRLGHQVHLFYSEIDHDQSSYTLRTGNYDGLPFWEIINNHDYKTFEETYRNPAVEKLFQSLLDEFKPDAVHFHHLLSLSYGCVRLCKERHIPVIFTLHDYWLTCPRGGQRYRGNGVVCGSPLRQHCAVCISRYSMPSKFLTGIIKKIVSYFEKTDSPNLIPAMQNGRIHVSNSSFVYRGDLNIDGDLKDVLFAHPPCKITFTKQIPANAELFFSIALSPATYDKTGEGVLFSIQCDGQKIFERHLHPKINHEDRGWKNETVSLKNLGGKKTFTFETKAYPNENIDYCSAAWGIQKLYLPRMSFLNLV